VCAVLTDARRVAQNCVHSLSHEYGLSAEHVATLDRFVLNIFQAMQVLRAAQHSLPGPG
jgi:hypothetical protein